MPTAGDDYIANDFRDPNYQANISTGAGEDFIWTHLFAPVMHIDGGSGFDIFKIPDGWLGNFSIQRTGNDYVINHNDSAHIIYITNVELVIIDTFDSYLELFQDPFFDDGNNYVDYNNLNDLQTGLFRSVNLYLSSNIRGGDLYPDLYNSGDGDDVVFLPDAANYVVHDDSYDPVDRIWDFAQYFNAGRGDDEIHGGDYHDKINGGEGFDLIWGGAGNDLIYDNAFDATAEAVGGWIDGGAGNDTVQLAFTPSRIVNASGVVVWSRGDPQTYNNSNGQQLFAEYLDAAGNVVGRVEMNNVESIIYLTSTTAPSEQLFSNYLDQVDFTQLNDGQRAAIDAMQSAGSLAGMYNALDGDDLVVLPGNGTILGTSTSWDSTTTFKAGLGQDHVIGSSGSDTIDGGGGDDWIEGSGGNDVLIDDGGNDELDGGTGADQMSAGYGDDDYYVDNAGDVATELSGRGDDIVFASISYTLNPYFERLTLIGTAAINGTGNGEQNIIIGNEAANQLFGVGGNDDLSGSDGDDQLDGGLGADILDGGEGNDTFTVDNAGDDLVEGVDEGTDTVLSSISLDLGLFDNVENLTLTGASLNGTGNGLANVLTGNSGDNELDGDEGNDTIRGGGGDDLLIGGLGTDNLDGGEGNDTASYEDMAGPAGVIVSLATGQETSADGGSLTAIENLIGSDFGDRLTGDSSVNILFGAGGDDLLNGGGGLDVLDGGEGSDIYVIASAGDHEAWEIDDTGAGSDVDEVRFSASAPSTLVLFTGDTGIERIVIGTGTGATAVTTGVGALNVDAYLLGNGVEIVGNSGANTIEATIFDDILSGGNSVDRLYGYEGEDTLDGGRGADVMYGGFDNDLYVVDDASDAPIETVDGGVDMVLASVAHTLKANVENLTQSGAFSIHATGNALNNQMVGNAGSNRLWGVAGDDVLVGNAGNDQLDGGLGNDDLVGGLGNDIYFVDSIGDTVAELADEGRDTVRSTVTWTLGANVEWLELQGSAAIDGTGNALANVLKGNSGANLLSSLDGNDKIYAGLGNDTVDGGAGNDWLEGGAGRDTYTGGTGSDRFVFRDGDFGGNTTATADVITDFGDTEGDRIRLDLVDANTGLDGNQKFAWLGTGAFTGTAGELRHEQIDGNTYVSGDTNGDGVADFMIALTGLHTLGTDDFIF